MRHLAFLFTFFVLALSIWPCCDDEANHKQTAKYAGISEEKPCDSNEKPHTCSPFFHCSSCQAFAVTPPIHKAVPAIILNKDTSYGELPISPIILFSGDIWQPPQLV